MSLSSVSRLLRNALQCTTGEHHVSETTDLNQLATALRLDLQGWREEETDEIEWVCFTVTAIKLQCNGRPVSELLERMKHAQELTFDIAQLAQEALRRTPTSQDALRRLLLDIEQDAVHIRFSLKELSFLYEFGGDALANAYAKKTLRWQKMYHTTN